MSCLEEPSIVIPRCCLTVKGFTDSGRRSESNRISETSYSLIHSVEHVYPIFSSGIDSINRVVADIPIQVGIPSRKANRVFIDELTSSCVVVPCAVVVLPRLFIKLSSGVATEV